MILLKTDTERVVREIVNKIDVRSRDILNYNLCQLTGRAERKLDSTVKRRGRPRKILTRDEIENKHGLRTAKKWKEAQAHAFAKFKSALERRGVKALWDLPL